MRFFKRVAEPDRFEESTDVFPPIDIERLSRDLKLEALGRERGAKNIPGVEDKGRDAIEHEAIDAVARLRSRGIAQYETHMRVYGDRLLLIAAANAWR